MLMVLNFLLVKSNGKAHRNQNFSVRKRRYLHHFDQILVLMVLLWIGRHLCMEGHLKLRVQSL